ncbi:hypothetical protein [Agrococcus jejuensis]|uniref:hypothetical protein n=1 Tax=Agrococcus jejuensis TaxID=399736 RepID=UPI0011A97A2C|nr:hypothetical protein [Agrococcus jejuensis]
MKAAREYVAATLRDHLPKSWLVIDVESAPDTLDRTMVRVRNERVRRAADAPLGAYDHTLLVRITSHHDDQPKAERDLEDSLSDLLAVIEDHLGSAWDEAEKVLDPDTNTLAWDVPVHVITTRED